MTPAQAERIAQFRKMAQDDPDNELGHFGLGKALLEAGNFAEAIPAFERAIALNPDFSKAYQYLGECYARLNQREKALEIFSRGYQVADRRGDRMPRDEMAQWLRQLGGQIPTTQTPTPSADTPSGFRCQRPGCPAGPFARPLPAPPMNDDLGRLIQERICADCWRDWLAMGIKVINELRLDLSEESGQRTYEMYMKQYLGLE
ncbi:MAG: Fe(2+)-trafficking protein [Gemmatales bacterium]|nr:Fe(2+)-trafficking protein [Gemmatales bacterium]MDW7994388.1 Fe(2+)-trafficking protein [Gemmatales bacterium]